MLEKANFLEINKYYCCKSIYWVLLLSYLLQGKWKHAIVYTTKNSYLMPLSIVFLVQESEKKRKNTLYSVKYILYSYSSYGNFLSGSRTYHPGKILLKKVHAILRPLFWPCKYISHRKKVNITYIAHWKLLFS
jgi:hypothetical protein